MLCRKIWGPDEYKGINTVLIRKISDVVRMEKPFNFWTDLAAYELLELLEQRRGGYRKSVGKYILCKRTTYLEEEKRQTEILLHELEEERKRTEELLYQLLPKAVAQTLMENGQVYPESFDSVTIMFSDVVGFTTIASISTPIQVVKMLNKLYMTIDEHLEHFDTYKVETIGDAYMVASGLPRRNGESHVIEVAKLAIDLLAEQIQIPHIENKTISLRIGINTARRIQMTESSATKLQQNGSFYVSERGKVNVKVIHATYNIVPLGATVSSSIRLDRVYPKQDGVCRKTSIF